jgi:hypothetical protein
VLQLSTYLEVQVVGLLMLFALSPIFILLAPREVQRTPGLAPGIRAFDEKTVGTAVILIAALCLGVICNRLIDDVTNAFELEGDEAVETLYNAGIDRLAQAGSMPAGDGTPAGMARDTFARSLKVAEFRVAEKNVYARSWFERRKWLNRIERGTAAAGIVFMLAMLFHNAVRTRWARECCARYGRREFVVALAIVVLSGIAFRSEATHYYNRACDMYLNLKDCGEGVTDATKAVHD